MFLLLKADLLRRDHMKDTESKSKRAKPVAGNVVQFPGTSNRRRLSGVMRDGVTAEGLLDLNEWITGGDPGYSAYIEDETIRFANSAGKLEWVLIKVP
jgi:hypothetical protein